MTIRNFDSYYDPPDYLDEPCAVCGGTPDVDCICPECPQCGEFGNTDCYRDGYLTLTEAQTNQKERIERESREAYLREIDDHNRWTEEEKRLMKQQRDEGPPPHDNEIPF